VDSIRVVPYILKFLYCSDAEKDMQIEFDFGNNLQCPRPVDLVIKFILLNMRSTTEDGRFITSLLFSFLFE